jgi:proline iminopeptidase
MQYKLILTFFLILTFLIGCKKDSLDKEGDYFFLRNMGADMPVWVRGNLSSNVFVIHLHGGPGGSSITEAQEKAFFGLEDSYAMVYWDQRGGGASQGNAKPETITMNHMVLDLEKLVALVKNKYNNPKIFLLGHSWGGALGTVYLTKNANQTNIQGWIEMDGAHNFKKSLELSRQWILNYADSAIIQGKDVSYWQDAKAWYSSNPLLNTKKILDEHANNYLNKANGYIFNPDNNDLNYFSEGNIFSPAGTTSSGNYVQSNLEIELSKGYSDILNKITIPSLILWGKNDGILPVVMSQDAFDNLGTDVTKKSKYTFQNSAHSPNREERVLFTTKTKEFIELYK